MMWRRVVLKHRLGHVRLREPIYKCDSCDLAWCRVEAGQAFTAYAGEAAHVFAPISTLSEVASGVEMGRDVQRELSVP